ncbi:MAG: CGLD27 family protein [Spirulinaceae cyanobacterium SM2_1_0]|nr:CGLD27 family protein [Spirulinaceae cyanobacterium SM2_1_0]
MQPLPLSACPVPEEQQPLNEYTQLKEAWPFCWTVQSRPHFARKLCWVWLAGWVIAGPIAAASFPPRYLPWRFLLAGSGGALFFLLLLLMRLYLGWWYVRDRLNDATVSYEESGWYDGQTWSKPAAMLMRDRLVVTYQITPILDRLRTTLLFLASCIGLGSSLWLLSA